MAEQQLPKWSNVGVEPPESLKTSGWQPGIKPAAQHMNWLFNRIYKCLEELQTSGATEEIEQQITDIETAVGDLTYLETDVKTNLVAAINDLKNKFAAHLAENKVGAHKASNISVVAPTGIVASNTQQYLDVLFHGYSSKLSDMVDALLLNDPSLPLNEDSTMQDVLDVINSGQLSGLVKSVQHLEVVFSSGLTQQDIVIANINPENSVATLSSYFSISSNTDTSASMVTVEIVNSTTVRLKRINGNGSLNISLEIIEFGGVKSKQSGEVMETWSANYATKTINVPLNAVNINKTLVFVTSRISDTGSHFIVTGQKTTLDSADNLKITVTRYNGASYFNYQVIEFN